jgi:hypothetical protein
MAISQPEAQQLLFSYLQSQAETDPAVLAQDSFYAGLRSGKSAEDVAALNVVIELVKSSAAAYAAG